MRRIPLLLLTLALPVAAHAQLVVRDGKPTTEATESAAPSGNPATPAEAVLHGTEYPAKAITAISPDGKVTDGSALPVTPPNQTYTPEDSPLWPADTVPLFVASCAKMHRQLDPACKCIITSLMKEMKHSDFVELSKSRSIEGDERYQRIRRTCVGSNLSRQP